MLVSGLEKTLTEDVYLKEERWVQVLSVLEFHLMRDETSLRESLWMSWTSEINAVAATPLPFSGSMMF